MSITEKNDRVARVIKELGLEACADTRVGTEFLRGISGGEKKRTCIGMELVLSPKILFLDEPTTGKTIPATHEACAESFKVSVDSRLIMITYKMNLNIKKYYLFRWIRSHLLQLMNLLYRLCQFFDSSRNGDFIHGKHTECEKSDSISKKSLSQF
jgi:ABC-type transporter Mla maintaining outer membrane lipid asymmetry ATPase subunit MlaF